MIKRIVVITLASALLTAAAARTLQLVEGAYETVLSDVTFPAGTAGTLIFRTCAGCDPIAIGVSSSTVFRLGQTALPLGDFLEAVESARQSGAASGTPVSVYYSLDNNRVTRLVVHLPPAD